MTPTDFESLKEGLKKRLEVTCQKGEYNFAIKVIIALITNRAGEGWQERRYTESQLLELFALADEYKNTPESGNSTGA